jgi:hypothetical protein
MQRVDELVRVDISKLDNAYRDLWNAAIAVIHARWDGSDESFVESMGHLIDVLDEQEALEFVQLDKSSTMSTSPIEAPSGAIPLDGTADSDAYDEHLDRIQRAFEAGELFNIDKLKKTCSVEKAQAYNIIGYWKDRGRIIKARRGKYYWTT